MRQSLWQKLHGWRGAGLTLVLCCASDMVGGFEGWASSGNPNRGFVHGRSFGSYFLTATTRSPSPFLQQRLSKERGQTATGPIWAFEAGTSVPINSLRHRLSPSSPQLRCVGHELIPQNLYELAICCPMPVAHVQPYKDWLCDHWSTFDVVTMTRVN